MHEFSKQAVFSLESSEASRTYQCMRVFVNDCIVGFEFSIDRTFLVSFLSFCLAFVLQSLLLSGYGSQQKRTGLVGFCLCVCMAADQCAEFSSTHLFALLCVPAVFPVRQVSQCIQCLGLLGTAAIQVCALLRETAEHACH